MKLDVPDRQTFTRELWPSSAQNKQRYLGMRGKTLASAIAASDKQFEKTISRLNEILVSFYSSDSKQLPPDFKKTFHELYRLLSRDQLKVFFLFEHDVLLLLARFDISLLPSSCTLDFLTTFDILLSEITKRYDDYSDEFESTLKRTSKIMGVFLISCFNFKQLSLVKVCQISVFVLKLTQYYLTLTELIDLWFTTALKDPDIMFLLSRNRLDLTCFPIFELAREFLFMQDDLAQAAKETFLHMVLISESSDHLENWIIESDFPDLIFTGLLLNFNQVCYNDDAITNVYDQECEELLRESGSFKEFDNYITFVINILSYPTHDISRIVFLKSLNAKFFSPLMEFHCVDSEFYGNVLLLLTYTIERILIPTECNGFEHSFILEGIANEFFDLRNQSSTFLLDLFSKESSSHQLKEPKIITSLLRLVSVLAHSNATNILTTTLFVETAHDDQFYDSPLVMMPLGSKMQKLIANDITLRGDIFKLFDTSTKRFKIYRLSVRTPKVLRFDSDGPLYAIICSMLFKFFENTININESLVTMLIDLIHANGGYNVGLFIHDINETSGSAAPEQILEHLWKAYSEYDRQVALGRKVIRAVNPSVELIEQLTKLGAFAFFKLNYVDDSERLNSFPLTEELSRKLSLFRSLMVEIFGAHQMSLMAHGVEFRNVVPF